MSQTSIKNSVVRPESIGWNVQTQKVSDSGNGQNGTNANVGAIRSVVLCFRVRNILVTVLSATQGA